MFAKMLSTILFMRQNPIYGVLYIVACFRELFICLNIKILNIFINFLSQSYALFSPVEYLNFF